MRAVRVRKKISTTIAPESHAYLTGLVRRGRATNFSDAIDVAVRKARRAESRARLERDTQAYFAGLTERAAQAEKHLEAAVAAASDKVDFEE